jgi:hypothetical protein
VLELELELGDGGFVVRVEVGRLGGGFEKLLGEEGLFFLKFGKGFEKVLLLLLEER